MTPITGNDPHRANKQLWYTCKRCGNKIWEWQVTVLVVKVARKKAVVKQCPKCGYYPLEAVGWIPWSYDDYFNITRY